MLDQDVQQRLLAVPNSSPALWMLSSFLQALQANKKRILSHHAHID
jgi:hypothetical protein